MTEILLDTDVLIEILRQRDPTLITRWRRLADEENLVFCSPVNIAELWHGLRAAEERSARELIDCLVCLAIDAEIGRLAGSYLRKYRGSHGVDFGDALIAATAVVHGCALWTRNRKHYPMDELSFF